MPDIKCLCGCSESLPWNGKGRRPKFLNDAHRMAFNRANKIKDPPPSQPILTPTLPTEIHPNQPLPDKYAHLDQNYFTSLPPDIAAYMPTRNDLNISLLIQSKPISKPIENPPW